MLNVFAGVSSGFQRNLTVIASTGFSSVFPSAIIRCIISHIVPATFQLA